MVLWLSADFGDFPIFWWGGHLKLDVSPKKDKGYATDDNRIRAPNLVTCTKRCHFFPNLFVIVGKTVNKSHTTDTLSPILQSASNCRNLPWTLIPLSSLSPPQNTSSLRFSLTLVASHIMGGQNSLSFALIAIHTVLALPAIYILVRHGRSHFLGWLYLLLVCVLQVTGSALFLSDQHSSGAAIITNICLSPLLLAILSILHEL